MLSRGSIDGGRPRFIAFPLSHSSGASILTGLGEQSPTFLKVGVDGLVILGFDRLLLVVALSIPVMPIVNRDYLKLVLLYVYVNSTQLSILEILTTAL